MLDLVLNNFTTDRNHGKKFFEKVLQEAINELGVGKKDLELSINLVGEGRIKTLNKKYLGKNKITDVLSFPLASRANVKLSQKNGIMALGDIFICLPLAKKHALKKGGGLDSWLALLAIHGLLHLLGYNHEKSTEEKSEILKLQNQILKRLAISD